MTPNPHRTILTTEQLAPEMLSTLTAQLTRLTTDQPTTAEIEEAIHLIPQIRRVLLDWASSRHLNLAHAQQAAAFRLAHPRVAEVMDRLNPTIPVNTPEEDAAMDELERRTLHPIFNQLLASVRPA